MSEAVDCSFSVEGSGAPLVLVHGIGAARDAWRFMAPRLKSHFKVISYDLRGHGASPVPDGRITLDDLVEDLARLCDRCDVERTHIAGHSLGGMIGPAFARRFPDRVGALGLLSTAAGRTPEDSAKVRGVVADMEKNGVESSLKVLVSRWFTDEFGKTNPDIVSRRLQQVLNTNERVFLDVFHVYAETEMLPWLHEVAAPCLVVTGENDGGCSPRLNRLIVQAFPRAELVVLPGLKHNIILEAPTEVADRLIEFINRHDPALHDMTPGVASVRDVGHSPSSR